MYARVHSIVMEASSKEDQKYMSNMDKNDIHQINGALIQGLYQSILNRKNIDFGDIPNSKGDIDKFKHIDSTTEVLDILEELTRKNNIDEPNISTIKIAISNMKTFRPQFIEGYKTNNDMIIMTYQTLVMTILDATSHVIAKYMEYLVSPSSVYTGDYARNNGRGTNSCEMLNRFNTLCANGKFADSMNYLTEGEKKAFAGETVIVTGVVIIGLLSVIPLIRELVYFYYHSRVKFSDYLSNQADFLEMNELVVKASTRPPAEKKNILKKQDAVIKKMRRTADKLAINDADANDVAKKETKSDNSLFSLSNIEKQLSKNKLDGQSFTIL